MKELKYCCDRFYSYAMRENHCHPNIRILKLVNPLYFRDDGRTKRKFLKNHLRFVITEGYSKGFTQGEVLTIFMEYCPFCGKDLFCFYKDDAYAHEIESKAFYQLVQK